MLQCRRHSFVGPMHRNTAYGTFSLKLGSVEMHTIDELAHVSGMPSRTIRFYNTQGMLPPPTMRGRVAYYSEEHLLFPAKTENGPMYSGDDILLLQLYERLEYLGLPIALPALIRFQLRQLAQ
jgi:DNA-binding transcriptional MerR regulator